MLPRVRTVGKTEMSEYRNSIVLNKLKKQDLQNDQIRTNTESKSMWERGFLATAKSAFNIRPHIHTLIPYLSAAILYLLRDLLYCVSGSHVHNCVYAVKPTIIASGNFNMTAP